MKEGEVRRIEVKKPGEITPSYILLHCHTLRHHIDDLPPEAQELVGKTTDMIVNSNNPMDTKNFHHFMEMPIGQFDILYRRVLLRKLEEKRRQHGTRRAG